LSLRWGADDVEWWILIRVLICGPYGLYVFRISRASEGIGAEEEKIYALYLLQAE
jgi:hypothetical protein